MIKNSLVGRSVCDMIALDISKIRYNSDLKKMLKNIEQMISDLSKKEVEARRLKSPDILQGSLTEINKAIDHLRQLVLIAQLIG